MSLQFELYWSFRSPYSYLATGRIVDLVKTQDVECDVRPVYPIAIRSAEFFDQVNPKWPFYLLRDTSRIAERLGIPYKWPNPDPVYRDPETGRYPPERQPYIYRLTRLGALAALRGKGLAFIHEISKTIWGGIPNWDEGDHLRAAAARAGCDLDEMDSVVAEEGERLETIIRKNQDDLDRAGHWGVPTMVFEGEPFFGQDRIEDLIWRMRTRGLKARHS